MINISFVLMAGLNLVLGMLVWRQLGITGAELVGQAAGIWALRMRWLTVGWFVLALGLGLSPLFQQPWATPAARPALPIGIMIPTVIGSALLWLAVHRRLVHQLPLAWLIGIHSMRALFGGLLLAFGMVGQVPWEFALEAGLGDILVGLLAIPLARMAAQPVPPRGLILAWNILGQLDLLNALRLGVTVVVPFLVSTQSPAVIAMLPLFGVPIYVLTHIYLFWLLLRPTTQGQIMPGIG
jgi:hypothetical protein